MSMFPTLCLRTRGPYTSHHMAPSSFSSLDDLTSSLMVTYAKGIDAKTWSGRSVVHKPNTSSSPSKSSAMDESEVIVEHIFLLVTVTLFSVLQNGSFTHGWLINDVCLIMTYNCSSASFSLSLFCTMHSPAGFIMGLLSCLWFKLSLPWSWRERGKAATRLILTECRVQCKCLPPPHWTVLHVMLSLFSAIN